MQKKEQTAPITPTNLDVSLVAGPALQQAITNANLAWLELLRLAALLGDSEPLAAKLLGLDEETLPMLASAGSSTYLLAQAHGLPLMVMRPELARANLVRTLMSSGLGSEEAVAALTAAMPLPVIERLERKRG